MTVKTSNIFTGGPDYVTGTVNRAPLGTAVPLTPSEVLNPAFKSSGYVADTGIAITPTRSTVQIKDLSGRTVREILNDFMGVITWSNLETNAESIGVYLGDNNVTVTPATATTGTVVSAAMAADDLPHQVWVFSIKDGERKLRVVVPDGQIIKQDKLDIKHASAIVWGVELNTYPDANGKYIYILTDDGVVASA